MMMKSIDTRLGCTAPAGWSLRGEADNDKLGGVYLRRTPDYDRAYSFAFSGPDVIVEVTAWPDNDVDFALASFKLRGGGLSARGGEDVRIPDADLATVLAVAMHLDRNF